MLLKSWENFYTRRLYHRIQDCWNRPVGSSPGAHITVMERDTKDGNKTLKYVPSLYVHIAIMLFHCLTYATVCQDERQDAGLSEPGVVQLPGLRRRLA